MVQKGTHVRPEAGEPPRPLGLGEPLSRTVRSVFDRLVAAGRIRAIPWHVFHFTSTEPALIYGQELWARRFGRSADADDSDTIAEVILHGLLA